MTSVARQASVAAKSDPPAPAAVLWDMDGTLVDSEKLWTSTLDAYARHRRGILSEAVRVELVGSHMRRSMRLVLEDLGVPAGERDVDEAAAWVRRHVADLFRRDLSWRPGAEQALRSVRAADIPTALVTSTVRSLTEIALETLGRDAFEAVVCGDEVDRRNKPDPHPYLLACCLLGVDPGRCVAVEDSPSGVTSAVESGCTVLAVPCEVPVPGGPRRVFRESLVGLDVVELGGLLPAVTAECR